MSNPEYYLYDEELYAPEAYQARRKANSSYKKKPRILRFDPDSSAWSYQNLGETQFIGLELTRKYAIEIQFKCPRLTLFTVQKGNQADPDAPYTQVAATKNNIFVTHPGETWWTALTMDSTYRNGKLLVTSVPKRTITQYSDTTTDHAELEYSLIEGPAQSVLPNPCEEPRQLSFSWEDPQTVDNQIPADPVCETRKRLIQDSVKAHPSVFPKKRRLLNTALLDLSSIHRVADFRLAKATPYGQKNLYEIINTHLFRPQRQHYVTKSFEKIVTQNTDLQTPYTLKLFLESYAAYLRKSFKGKAKAERITATLNQVWKHFENEQDQSDPALLKKMLNHCPNGIIGTSLIHIVSEHRYKLRSNRPTQGLTALKRIFNSLGADFAPAPLTEAQVAAARRDTTQLTSTLKPRPTAVASDETNPVYGPELPTDAQIAAARRIDRN